MCNIHHQYWLQHFWRHYDLHITNDDMKYSDTPRNGWGELNSKWSQWWRTNVRMSRYVFAAILPTLWILNRQCKRYITNVTLFCSNTISDNNSWPLNIAYVWEVDLYRYSKFPGGDYTVTMGISSLISCSLPRLNGIDYKYCNFIGSYLSSHPSIKLIWLFSKVDRVGLD